MNDDLLEIIRDLTPQKLLDSGMPLEEELLQLRLAAGRELQDSRREAEVTQPVYQDIFPNISGVPEIVGSDLSVDALAAGLLHHGALLVRGLYSPRQLAQLEQLAASQEEANRGETGALGCGAHTLFELLEIYRGCGLLAVITEYLDGEPLMFAERAKLRHHRAGRDKYAAIPWHQDVNFFGPHSGAVNCWAAVTPCGRDNPGLEIIPWHPEERLGWNETDGLAPLDYGRALPEELLTEITALHPPVKLELEPGDAVLFDEMTVHQTALKQWKREEQVVTISWFFRAAGFPDWGTPLAV